jgi:hypothetical protein
MKTATGVGLTTPKVFQAQSAVELKHVNTDEKHVSSSCTDSSNPEPQDIDHITDAISNSSVALFVPAAVKRRMGMKTSSQKRKPNTGERVYSIQTPMRFIIPRADNKIYSTVQSYVPSTLVSSTSGPTYFAYYFQVSNLDQISSFTSLFDQYRIKMVEVMTIPLVTNSIAATSVPGILNSVVDYDDANTLSGNQALDYQNCMTSSGFDGHYRRFVPHAALAAYSGTFASYANVASPWIDAASTSVQHYGVKFVWSTTDAVYTQDVYFHLHLEWRNLR